MIGFRIFCDGDGCWPDLDGTQVEGAVDSIARLPGGLQSGRSSVTLRINLPDGKVVLAQTSLRLLGTAVRMFEAVEDEENKKP